MPRPFRYIEPSLAKQVAQGDACPISLLPMEDINPSFVPRALKPIPMNTVTPAGHRPDKGKGKAKNSGKPSAVGPLRQFFCEFACPRSPSVTLSHSFSRKVGTSANYVCFILPPQRHRCGTQPRELADTVQCPLPRTARGPRPGIDLYSATYL